MATFAHVTGWGMAVPERVMTNEDIAQLVETSDEWIRERTGIRERRIAGPEETTGSLATAAALKALQLANLSPREVDLIIVATSSPEHLFPSTASIVQDNIGAVDCGAFDLLAACTGFIYAMSMAADHIKTGAVKNALVIGSETLSRLVNWHDRSTCILFGDGAGAFVLQASEEPGGILSSFLRSDGSGADLLTIPAGGSSYPASNHTLDNEMHFIRMNGREVYRFATRVMARATQSAVSKANLSLDDISLIIPHQANLRIIDAAARGLKLPMDRFMVNVDRYGNTSTASIPIAAVEAVETGRLQNGDNVVLVGFGAGLTWGALTMQWTGPMATKGAVDPRRTRLRARLRSYYRRLGRRIEGILFGKN